MYWELVLVFQYWVDCWEDYNRSEAVEIILTGKLAVRVLALVIPALGVHIIDHPYGEQVKLRDMDAKLYAAEQEQRCRHP